LAAETEAGVQHAASADVTVSAASAAVATIFTIIFVMSKTLFVSRYDVAFRHSVSANGKWIGWTQN
jgi:hypothetical protein